MEANVRIKRIIDEAHDTKSFVLEKPHGFSYIAGQYILMEAGGEERAFSLSSSPTEDFLMVSVRMGASKFKKKLTGLREVKITGPFGKFFLGQEEESIMLAGGIGITPFRSMIKTAAGNHKGKITLIYSNKTESEIAFRKDFDETAHKNKNIRIVYTVTRPEESPGWRGVTDRMDEKMIRDNCNAEKSVFYVCGPPAMVDGMTALLKTMGVSSIKFEKFTGY